MQTRDAKAEQTLQYCLDRLIAMIDNHTDMRQDGREPSARSIRLVNSYGEAVKAKFDDLDVNNAIDDLLKVANQGFVFEEEESAVDDIDYVNLGLQFTKGK